MKAHILHLCAVLLSLSAAAFAEDLGAADATALVKRELAKTHTTNASSSTCTFAVCVADSDKAPVVIVGRPFTVKDGETDYQDKAAGMLFRGTAQRTEDHRRLIHGDLSIIILAHLPKMADAPPPTINLHVNAALPQGTLTLLSGSTGETVNHTTGEKHRQSTYLFCQND